VAQQVGLAALSGPQDWIRKFVADSERRATLVHEELSAIGGIVSQQPAGGLNLLVRFTGDTDELVRRLIFQGGVPVHPGEAFGAPGYFRLQFGAPDDAARAALAQLSKIVGSLSA
jgi:aspartate aminotransferase